MPDPQLVSLNGIPYSWTSTAHFFAGLPYKGVTAVNFKETREVKLVHAAQQDGVPVGTTSGLYRVENVSFTLLRDSAYALMADLSVLGLGSYGDAEFMYLLQLFEPVPGSIPPQVPSVPQSVTLAGCRITGVDEKQQVGSDELVTEFTVTARYVVRPVGTLWSAQRSLYP